MYICIYVYMCIYIYIYIYIYIPRLRSLGAEEAARSLQPGAEAAYGML